MSYGWNNHFDDNRRSNFRGNFDDDPFSRGFSSNDNFDLRRQRSPIFNERSNFNSQMPSNFSSFPSRSSNFGYEPQQQQTHPDSKVYHVPIHIEKDDNQSSPMSNSATANNQHNKYQSNVNNNYQNNDRSNDAFDQQSFFNREQQPSKNYPGSSIRNTAAEEFKRQESELRRKQEEFRRQNDLRDRTHDTGGNEFRIPIRVERNDSNDSNLVRDFNNMHGPSVRTVRENKPGQKQSTNQNEKFMDSNFADHPSFNQAQPPQPQYQQQNYNQQDQSYSNQQRPQQSQPEVKKPLDPMSIIQNILEEVEKYEHEIDNFTGEFQDKQYRYLDEYLTRSMLKLDSIDTNGDANLKQSRKNALNYINRVIAKLEKLEKVQSEPVDDKTETKQAEEPELDKSADSKNLEENLEAEKKDSEDAKTEEPKISSDKKSKSKDQGEERKKKSTKSDTKEKKKIKKDDN